MSLINFSGIASGIDSSSLIQAMLDQERAARVNPLADKIAGFKDTNSSLYELSSLLNKLKGSADKFRTLNGSVMKKSGASSDETVLTAAAGNSASNGTYSITVSQLARNATYSFDTSSGSYSAADSVINSSINNGAAEATRTVSVVTGTGDDEETVDIVLTDSTTLNDFVTEYNNSSTKGVASVVNIGTSASPDYRIAITTSNEGLDKGQISVSVGSEITSAGSGAFNNNSVSQATNATLSISGISGTITRQTNSVSDVVPGVTFNLQSTGTATLTVRDDSAATSSSIQDFVDAYNEVVGYIAENDLVTREEDGSEVTNIFGPLADLSLDENILSALRSALSGSATSGGSVNLLADLGITTERDGTLKFDAAVFEDAMSSDPEGVRTITQSLGDTLANTDGTIAQFTRFNGLIDQTARSNSEQISSMEKQIASVERSLLAQEQSLTSRYARLEALIGQLNSQQSALASILP